MDIALIVAILILVSLFALALLILYRGQGQPINQVFSALIFFIGFWVASNILAELSFSLTGKIFWNQLKIIWAAAVPSLGVYFTYVFPKKEKLAFWKKILLVITPLFFLVFSPTRSNISSIRLNEFNQPEVLFGSLYPLLFLQFLIFVPWAFYRLLKKYFKSRGATRLQLRYIFVGAGAAILLAALNLIVLPSFGIQPPAIISVISIFFFVSFSAYSVLRHYLAHTQVMTAEIFTGLLLLVLLANVFTFRSKEQLILNLALFLSAVVFGVFLIRSVITEARDRERLELLARKIEKANKKLWRLDKAKSEFISIASHQLRTPLSIIKGYVSMILDGTYGNLDKEKKEILKRVYASNERLIGLVNDLLDLSRIERGKLEFSFKPLDLSKLLISLVKEFKIRAKDKGLKLSYRFQKLPPINVDQDKIRQVFANIIDNGIKYTEEGGIKIETKITKKKVIFSFANTGAPLTEEEMESIYEKFRRGKTGVSRHPGGMGLGLYIANKIVQAHKGRLWAKNAKDGKGCTFYVELPRAHHGR